LGFAPGGTVRSANKRNVREIGKFAEGRGGGKKIAD